MEKKKQNTRLVSNALPSSRENRIDGKINPKNLKKKKKRRNKHHSKEKRNQNAIEETEKLAEEN